ncbi:hypothetical protein ACQ4M3_41895 [Leptolyngbya sp. AN03gr2]|uniref:hypothetical protein n=1 Tax=unclassified Leptolyngbya TaxID=2650499 RepID=UPI003D313B0E
MVNKKTKSKVQPEPNPVPPTPEPALSENNAEVSPAIVDEKPATKAKSSRTTKKTEIPPVEAVIPPIAEPVIAEPVIVEPVPQKSDKKAEKEKATKLKRLTLDIPKPLHKAIKAQAVEEGIPMVDMLRTLLENHYSKQ